LNKRLRKNDYRVTYDQAFEAVIQHCADISRPDQQGTWIGEQMIAAYTELYQRGIAHSVEVWRQNELIGGLYGLALGKVFFGESMFSLATDASKIAFVTLAQKLSAAGYALMDCQVSNPHLFTLGAEEIDRQQFMSILRAHVDQRGEAF
jgi:leucyl/phenylalanyl-tRNA--protein transferase